MTGLQRDIGRIASGAFDLVVIGAGIHGACVARDAALRGLKVAVLERGDLGGETSHNSPSNTGRNTAAIWLMVKATAAVGAISSGSEIFWK